MTGTLLSLSSSAVDLVKGVIIADVPMKSDECVSTTQTSEQLMDLRACWVM